MRSAVGVATVVGITVVTALLGSRPADAVQPTSQWDGVFTQDQANRGESLYTKRCSACHGGDLAGDEYSPPLREKEFLDNWNNKTIGALFEQIQATMPQNSPGILTPQQTADILAYVFSANNFPVGKTELSTEVHTLERITFLAVTP